MTAGVSPAEQRAIDRGLPVIPVIVHELMNVAGGHPIIVRALDGGEVLLRLPTADELIQSQREALATLPEEIRPELMSRARAEDLCGPLVIPGWSS